jgi:activator of HSP90 ATPase
MKTIKQTYHIHGSLEQVWQALINAKEIDRWGGGSAKMDDKKGTEFSLWGGSIWGKNIEVIPHKKLVQEWYSESEKKWKKPSIATFTLAQEKDRVRIDFLQTDVPDEEEKSIADGWKEYYLGPLKEYVERSA